MRLQLGYTSPSLDNEFPRDLTGCSGQVCFWMNSFMGISQKVTVSWNWKAEGFFCFVFSPVAAISALKLNSLKGQLTYFPVHLKIKSFKYKKTPLYIWLLLQLFHSFWLTCTCPLFYVYFVFILLRWITFCFTKLAFVYLSSHVHQFLYYFFSHPTSFWVQLFTSQIHSSGALWDVALVLVLHSSTLWTKGLYFLPPVLNVRLAGSRSVG